MNTRVYMIAGILILIGGVWNYYRAQGGLTSVKHLQDIPENDFFTGAATNPEVVLIDFRTPDEYKTGRIMNAINIDFLDASFRDKISELDQSKVYYIYCHSGQRSGKAGKEMKSLGFRSVYNLAGGISNWSKPIEK